MILSGLRTVSAHRHFVVSSIQSELKARFVTSRMGGAWLIIHPLMMAAIYTLVLSKVLGAKIPGMTGDAAYAIYLMAGLAIWLTFSEILNRTTSIFIEFGERLKKIRLPKSALPAIVIGSSLVNHVLFLGAILAVFLVVGHPPSLAWIALPIGLAVTVLLSSGLGLLLAVFNTFVRDVGQTLSVALNLWFWLTPIVYPKSILPDGVVTALAFNPVANLTSFYQDIMLYGSFPSLVGLIYPLCLAAVFWGIALFLVQRSSAEIIDVL